ncbi:plasmid segregation protein ParM [Escherichia albertii]|nr:plasmid segregation protein ParM [Escherichia albertii]
MSQPFDFDKALKALQSGQALTGKDGILMPLIKQLTEAALAAELDSHLAADVEANSKNGFGKKTIKATTGSFELATPRDRNSTFDPQQKHQTTLSDEIEQKMLEDGEVRTSLSGNSFKEGWNPRLFNAGKVYNYVVDGKKYTYDLGSTAVIGTTHVSYQYSTTNLLAIHHALLTSGLQPQDVELTVTLPVTEFFDNDNQPNEERIERKKANVLREISLNKGETFKIKKVNVMPESLPAAFESLKKDKVNKLERSLIIDLGGTTLDCGLILGAFEGISEIRGYSEIGTSRITHTVMNALTKASTPCNYFIADELIKNRHDNEYLQTLINDVAEIKNITHVIDSEVKSLAESIRQEISTFSGMNRIYLTGGGAELIYPHIKQYFPNLKVNKVDEPQFALVKAMVHA